MQTAFLLLAVILLTSALGASAATPLIPRELLFGNPDKAAPRISPDGLRIAYLAPSKGVLNVWVGLAEAPSLAQPVTHDTGRGIRQFFWAYTSRHIVYLQDKGGDENWRAYSVDIKTGAVKDLTPLEKVAAQIEGVSERFPTEIIVGLNDRDPQLHDLYRINIETGERTLLKQNEGFAAFVTDDDYKVRFAMALTPDGGAKLMKPKAGGGWQEWTRISSDDMMSTGPLGFDKSGKVMYMRDSRGRDTSALTQIDLETGATTLIAEDSQADISGVLTHPTEKTIQAYKATYARGQWRVVDPDIAHDLGYLRGVADGDFEITSRSLNDRRWTVAYIMDNGPVRYYLYEHDMHKETFLFTNRHALEGAPLSKMHSELIKSRDGLKLISYLTLPREADVDNKGLPARPLPMVLYVHGGPWARDDWGYNPVHQWLANRGYAVLSVNYRGSTGFGKAFVNASSREWGGKMHDDLIDAVNWAIEHKIADPGRIAIMGGSYGGYATLVGVTFTPDVFACGVDIVGPSNLLTFMKTIPPYWKPMLDMFKQRVGDDSTEGGRAFLKSRSPLTFVDHIKRPLLIGQGANDPRVNKDESDQIVKAMQSKHIPVTYVLYPDEGHGFALPQNSLSFFAITEAFLAAHLGGLCEPIGKDFVGSSLQVPTGADQIPGLPEALKPSRRK